MENIEKSLTTGNFSDKKKTKYFSSFASGHFSDMKILREGGILGKENEDWRNISEHCLVEAVGADILAEVLLANRDKTVQAALLHDWFKRKEIEAMKSMGGGEGYKQTISEDERILKEHGVDEDVIKIAHSNIPQSADPEYLSNRTIEQKIMHFIDAVTSGTEFVSIKERFDALEKKQRNIDFSNSFMQKFNKSLYDLQRELTELEQEEFEQKLGLERGSLISFIKAKIEERISAAQ